MYAIYLDKELLLLLATATRLATVSGCRRPKFDGELRLLRGISLFVVDYCSTNNNYYG